MCELVFRTGRYRRRWKKRSRDGWIEIIGKKEQNREAAIWRSTGVRGGDNKGTEIEWRPSRGMRSPVTLQRAYHVFGLDCFSPTLHGVA